MFTESEIGIERMIPKTESRSTPLAFISATSSIHPGILGMVIAVLAVATGAVIQGSVGLGLGLLAAPILALIDPRLIPGPLLFAALGLTILVSRREWSAIDFSGLKWALIGRVAGTLLAGVTLMIVPKRDLAMIFGALILAAVALTASGMSWPPTARNLILAGFLSGLMGTLVSIGGPPMALVYQRASGPRLRGTLSSFFVIGATLSLIMLGLVGRFGIEELIWGSMLLPGTLLGFAISNRTAPLLDRGYIRPAVLIISALAGVMVILREVL